MLTPTEWLPPFDLVQLFSKAECAQIIEMAKQTGMSTAKKILEDGSQEVDEKYRSCEVCTVRPGNPIYELIADRLFSRLSRINQRYEFDLHAEREQVIPSININRYAAESGGKIGDHTDTGHFKGTDDRKLSLAVLLNDSSEFQSGHLVINDGLIHTPLMDKIAGNVVIFPSFALHGVRPVLQGERWSAVIWLRGPRYR